MCILHCENRTGEKFLKMLLIEGWNLLDGDKKGQDQYIKEFEYMVNTQVLGTQ